MVQCIVVQSFDPNRTYPVDKLNYHAETGDNSLDRCIDFVPSWENGSTEITWNYTHEDTKTKRKKKKMGNRNSAKDV